MMMDLYPHLITHLLMLDGVRAVYRDLPHDFQTGPMPAVHLLSAGPAQRLPTAQGLGFDVVGIDVDIYVPAPLWVSGAAMSLADAVRKHLKEFRRGATCVWDVSRPELLPVVRSAPYRRVGMTADIATPTF